MDSEYNVARLTADDVRPGDETAIVGLFAELHEKDTHLPLFTQEHIMAQVRDNHFFVAREPGSGKIVGMATLVTTTYFGFKKGLVEEVVVSPDHRGKKIAKSLMAKLLAIAREAQLDGLYLTSGDHRVAAQRLYRELGFKEKNVTRPFVMSLY